MHAYGSAVSPQLATSLDLLFAPRPRVTGLSVIANINPGGGYHADVFAHRGMAYLSSWHGEDCPGTGVRVIDLTTPSWPEHGQRSPTPPASQSSADMDGEVDRARGADAVVPGTLAVTSMQHCDESAFRGFGL